MPQGRAAKAWSVWEGRTSKLLEDPSFVAKYSGDAFSIAFARIECHYFVNRERRGSGATRQWHASSPLYPCRWLL